MDSDDQSTQSTDGDFVSDDNGGVAETLKRALSTGIRTFLKSEENIRQMAGEIWRSDKVEAVGSAISNVREELVRVAGREFVRYLDRLNLTDEVVKILTSISFELKTEIRFIPNDQRLVTPNIKAAVRMKRSDQKKKAPAAKKRRKKKTS